MCTYDYTPYEGCDAGDQHYFIQWVKCNRAVENGRYCSLDASAQVEQLRKLSANVLSCPLHGPIAVQQYVLEPANAPPLGGGENTRARSTARRGNATSRSRTPARGAAARDFDQPAPRRAIRQRRSKREMAAESSDSESSTSLSPQPRTADRPRRSANHSLEGRRNGRTAQSESHRRSISADLALPSRSPLSMRHGHSEIALPLTNDRLAKTEELGASAGGPQQQGPKFTLDIPLAAGVVGLPTSPDMHRRSSVHRSRSEGLLRQPERSQLEPIQPVARTAVSPSSDSSPDHNAELPFANPARRGRRPGARSVRDRSVDTAMRRIDEVTVPEETEALPKPAAPGPRPIESRSSTRASPEPQSHAIDRSLHQIASALPPQAPHHRRSGSRPRLNSLQIPEQRDRFQRDAYSAPTATPPETDITAEHPPIKKRTKSLRHVDISNTFTTTPVPAAAPGGLAILNLTLPPSNSSRNDDTASLRSTRSRRFREDQVADGRRWAAAREHMPLALASLRGPVTDVLAHMSGSEPSLAAAAGVGVVPAVGARESVDSGYRSGHAPQRSWETVRSSVDVAVRTGVVGGAGGGGGGVKAGRNTLQKAPPASLPVQQQQHEQQGQAGMGIGVGGKQRHVPEPLNLARLPPCALPVSLVSPGFQSDADSMGKGGKGAAALRQRMGLRKKISGLLWDRGGGREVGAVEG